MKLNKLLPIAALAGATTVVAPLATSCTEIDFTKVEYEVNQDNIYDWEFQATRERTLNVKKATNVYFDDIAKNPAILMDEIIASMLYSPVPGNDQNNMQLDVKINDINPTNHRISLDYHIIIEMTITDDEGNVYETDIDTTYKLNNIEYCVDWELPEWTTNDEEKSYNFWVVRPKMVESEFVNILKMRSDKQWSLFIDSHTESYLNGEKVGGEDIDELTFDHKSDDKDLTFMVDPTLQTTFTFKPSYYLHTAIPV